MMKFEKKAILLFVCIFIVTTYMGHVVAVLYAEDVLDKIRTNPTKTDVQIRAELERLQQIAKNKKQKDVEQQLASYIKKYFPAGPVRIIGENEIVLQKPREGETYVLRPTSETERAEGHGDWRQVRQEGLVLLDDAPAGSVAKPTLSAEDRDKGDYYWNEKKGVWVFVSNQPIQLSGSVSESVAPASVAPIAESAVSAETVVENVPAAPPAPPAPPVPVAPGVPAAPVAPAIPGAPPVPVAPPIAPNVPGAPPTPAAPVAPIGGRVPPKKSSGKKGGRQEEKKELEALSEAAQQTLSDEQKKQSDRLLVDTLVALSRTCVKPTPGEMYPVTLENYKKSVKSECSELLKNESFFKRAELAEIRDRKFDLFLQDNTLDNLDAVNNNFDVIVAAGVDMFSGALFDRTMMSEQAVRYLVAVFACLYRNPQDEGRFDASMSVSNYHVIAATEQSNTIEQLIDRLIMLCINREFLHYKRPSDNSPFYLLDSWLNEEDSKPKETEKPGEPWKIPLLHVLAKPEFYNKGAVLGIVKRLVSTMREQLLYAEVLDLEDEERLRQSLVLIIGNYQRTIQPAKVPVSQGVVDIDSLLNWNNIETFVDLEGILRKIAKQIPEKAKKVDLEKLSQVIKVSPDKDEEVKKLYKALFKDSGIGVDALYAKHRKEIEVVRTLRLARARSQKIRAEAEGLKKANKFAEAERLSATAYQGALLYAVLRDIYEENLPGFVTNGFTELYRRSDSIYKVLDTLIKKSVGSLSALGFSKEDFALMIEPYGLLLMMLDEFNKTKEYQKLVNGLIALDTATKKADEESFGAVVNNEDYIHDITTYALYKNRLKKLRMALDNFDIKGASTAVKQLVKRADLYTIKNPVRGAADVDVIRSAGIDITQRGNFFIQYQNFSRLMEQVENELARVFYAKIMSRIQALSQGGISEKEHTFKLPEPSEHTGWTRKSRDPYLLVAIVKAQTLRPLQQVFVGKTIMDSALIDAVDKSLADLQSAESLQAVVRKTLDERWSGVKPDNYQEILAAEVALIVAYIHEYLKIQRDVLEKVQSAVPPVKRVSVAEQEAESKAQAERAWEEDVEERAALMGF